MPPAHARFRLERHRSQWSHLPLAFGPFFAVFGLVVFAMLAEGRLGERATTALAALAGGCFVTLVLAMPFLWRRWRARGAAAIELDGETLRLVTGDTTLGTCRLSGAPIAPRTFRYTVWGRYHHGTYRVPAFALQLGARTIVVGVPGTTLRWREPGPEVTRPDYIMTPADWAGLVTRLQLAGHMTDEPPAPSG